MAAPAPSYFTLKSQVPVGPGQALGFTTGKGYYARPAGSSPLATAAASDPYAALTGYEPLTNAQITSEANQEISPIIQAITSSYNNQAGQQVSNMQQWTDEVAQALGGINMAAPYQQAEGQQAAVDSALQQSLTGAGSSEAAGLANQLSALQGSSGAPALSQAAAALTSQGQSSGNTALANGSASLSDLIANAAAASNFGQKMPLIADLAGAQQIGAINQNNQQAIDNAVLQEESQLPDIIQNLTANDQTALSNAATAEQATQQQNYEKGLALFEQSGKLTPEAAMLMGLPASDVGATTVAKQNANTAAAKAKAEQEYQQTEAALKQEDIQAANSRAAASIKAAMARLVATGKHVNASASAHAGYLMDNDGNAILGPDGKPIPVKASTSSSSSSTVPPWGK